MTVPHSLQLHLFDAQPDLAEIPPECRLRLLRLTGDLLQEAALGGTSAQDPTSFTEIVDE